MGFQFRYRVKVPFIPKRTAWLNLSKSGVSGSARLGRVTANSRGTVWFRILRGLFYRGKV
jgi:hypothetical protein